MTANTMAKNVHDFLIENSYEIVDDARIADAVIIVTCIVSRGCIRKSENIIKKYAKYKNTKTIIALGCITGERDIVNRNKGIIFIGVKDLDKFNHIFQVQTSIQKTKYIKLHKQTSSYYKFPPTFLPQKRLKNEKDIRCLISVGCANNCSYCNIKKAIGYVKSKSISDIIEEIKRSIETGNEHLDLMSHDTASYGLDINTNLSNLLFKLLAIFPKIKISIHNLYPSYLVNNFQDIKKIFQTGRITSCLMPMQTMSKRITKLMNRNYNPVAVLDKMKIIKKISPKTKIKTHFMFNFPTETEKEFLEMFKAHKYFNYTFFNQFDYPNRTSFKLPSLDRKTANKRLIYLNKKMDTNSNFTIRIY